MFFEALWLNLNTKIPRPPTNWTILVMKHYLPSMWYAYQQKSGKKELTNFIYYICIAYKTIYLMDEYH